MGGVSNLSALRCNAFLRSMLMFSAFSQFVALARISAREFGCTLHLTRDYRTKPFRLNSVKGNYRSS